MQISARSDYATRALLVLATHEGEGPITGESIAAQQGMPSKFVENILVDLKRSGLVASKRGAHGGFLLGRPADEITVADVIRAVDGPMAAVRGEPPESIDYPEPANALAEVWIATRASLRRVLEHVTLADIVAGDLPEVVAELAADPDARARR